MDAITLKRFLGEEIKEKFSKYNKIDFIKSCDRCEDSVKIKFPDGEIIKIECRDVLGDEIRDQIRKILHRRLKESGAVKNTRLQLDRILTDGEHINWVWGDEETNLVLGKYNPGNILISHPNYNRIKELHIIEELDLEDIDFCPWISRGDLAKDTGGICVDIERYRMYNGITNLRPIRAKGSPENYEFLGDSLEPGSTDSRLIQERTRLLRQLGINYYDNSEE